MPPLKGLRICYGSIPSIPRQNKALHAGLD
jgi:hypothetical protein